MPLLEKIDRSLAWNLPGDFLKDVYPRGMRRLAEYGLFRGWTTVRTRYGFAVNVNRLDAIKWCIYYFGQFEPQISRAFANFLRPGDTVIDIGGNIGYHTLLSASKVGKSGRIFTFEPSSRNFSELEKNVRINGFDNVSLNKVAVSNENGKVKLYFGGDNVQGNSSLIEENATGHSEDVTAITFDDIAEMCDLSTVALIKIDVEGAEPLVISRLTPLLPMLRSDCAIFLEISPNNAERGEQLLEPFLENGFHVRTIRNEYNPKFFRSDDPVALHDLDLRKNTIVDVVLMKDPEQFDRLQG